MWDFRLTTVKFLSVSYTCTSSTTVLLPKIELKVAGLPEDFWKNNIPTVPVEATLYGTNSYCTSIIFFFWEISQNHQDIIYGAIFLCQHNYSCWAIHSALLAGLFTFLKCPTNDGNIKCIAFKLRWKLISIHLCFLLYLRSLSFSL